MGQGVAAGLTHAGTVGPLTTQAPGMRFPTLPHPLSTTAQIANLGLSPETMDALANRGIFSLFPVQAQVGRVAGRPPGGTHACTSAARSLSPGSHHPYLSC